jgi:hypothetical protein
MEEFGNTWVQHKNEKKLDAFTICNKLQIKYHEVGEL